jgi:hypothetical protein
MMACLGNGRLEKAAKRPSSAITSGQDVRWRWRHVVPGFLDFVFDGWPCTARGSDRQFRGVSLLRLE